MTDSQSTVTLREVLPTDLSVFFEQQLDPEANFMAAFAANDPTDRSAFDDHWNYILNDPLITKRTILFNDQIAGTISSFEQFGSPSVSYWIGKEYWGKGIATKALTLLLAQLETRPLFARAAKDNLASIRVLQKCGFRICGHERGFANARQSEIDEVILKLAD
jgi:RimJ/RimL family protein N-acetyltransferase